MSLIKDTNACALYGHTMTLYSDGSQRCGRPGCGFQISQAMIRAADTCAMIEARRKTTQAYGPALPPIPMPSADCLGRPNAPSPINLGGSPIPSNASLLITAAFVVLGLGAFIGGAVVRFFL